MSLSILIVDDDAVIRSLIVRALRESGLRLSNVLEAENGEEGLRLLENNHVDFVLVDLNMPIVDGEQMINRIRENPEKSRVPVIFISGEPDQTRVKLVAKKGVGFILKPFSAATLGRLVMDLLAENN